MIVLVNRTQKPTHLPRLTNWKPISILKLTNTVCTAWMKYHPRFTSKRINSKLIVSPLDTVGHFYILVNYWHLPSCHHLAPRSCSRFLRSGVGFSSNVNYYPFYFVKQRILRNHRSYILVGEIVNINLIKDSNLVVDNLDPQYTITGWIEAGVNP